MKGWTILVPAALLALAPGVRAQVEEETTVGDRGVRVEVRGTDARAFPEVTLDFEVRRPDGTAVLDARREDFAVEESGQAVEVLRFQAPVSVEVRPTRVVLVVDKSRSMILEEDRMTPLKQAVRAFLDVMPAGSEVAVVAFSSDVRLACDFTAEAGTVREAVEALEAGGGTRFYDAVAAALDLIADQPGRRAVLALTDGEDTLSEEATLGGVIRAAREVGVPIHTLGVGTEEAIAGEELRQLADETRGRYFNAREASELRGIYEEVARGLGESYSLTYRTGRRLPDGTLRPVRVVYRAAPEAAGTAEFFVRGMVVPVTGWDRLFLVLVGALTALALVPGWRRSRRKRAGTT